MVYIKTIEDTHALIFDGPVTHGQVDAKILTSADLDDVKDSWEFNLLADKEAELPALRQNACDALTQIELHIRKPITESRILDFGSGWGFFLSVAKQRGWEAYGLEPLPASAVYARAKFALNITTDTLRDNTFPPNFFDAITSFQVFEHLPYPKEDIQRLHKMLAPNGIILIEVPNFATWTMRLMKSRHRHFVQDHLNFFFADTLQQLLANHGFHVLDIFSPKRNMSTRHLVKTWLPRYLPKSIVGLLYATLQRTRLLESTIGLNIGDIVTVIARKV